MKKTYRKGGIGAMMDEYERAAGKLETERLRLGV